MTDRLTWDSEPAAVDWGFPSGEFGHYDAAFVVSGIQGFVPEVLDRLALQPGDHVLDVACGTGVATRPAAAQVGRAGRVVGLDLSPSMLDIARRKPQEQPDAAAIEWIEGDAGALPFPDQTFDAVCCVLGVHLFVDRIGALHEMRRVLKPDGRVAIMTWGAIEQCPGQVVMRTTWTRHFGEDQRWLFDAQHALSDPDEVRSLLEAAGFDNVSVDVVMGMVRWDSPEMITRAYGTSLEIAADEQTRARIFDDVRQALQEYMGEDGLAYPIEAVLGSVRR